MSDLFVEYLPVEGELKEGELGLYPGLNFVGILTYKDRSEVGARNCGHYLINDVDFLGVTPSQCKPVRFFLCDRDVQPGDEIKAFIGEQYCTGKVAEIRGTEVIPETISLRGARLPLKDCFKMVGEISPETTWLKRGQKVNEEDVQRCWQPGGEGSETWNLVPLSDIKNLNEAVFKPYIMVKIKCPNCKIFH